MQTFNGWTNWDTWNANLWLNNDYELYILAIATLGRYPDQAAFFFENYLRESFQLSDCVRNGQAWDGIDFDAVNWDEIIAGFVS